MTTATTAIQRLGNVLYWLGCIGAAIMAIGVLSVLAAFGGSFGGVSSPAETIFFGGISAFLALLSWLIGRACKYVLAGK